MPRTRSTISSILLEECWELCKEEELGPRRGSFGEADRLVLPNISSVDQQKGLPVSYCALHWRKCSRRTRGWHFLNSYCLCSDSIYLATTSKEGISFSHFLFLEIQNSGAGRQQEITAPVPRQPRTEIDLNPSQKTWVPVNGCCCCLSLWLWTRHFPCWVSVFSSVQFWGLEVSSQWWHFLTVWVCLALLVTPLQAENTGLKAYLLKTYFNTYLLSAYYMAYTMLGTKGTVVKKIDTFPTYVCGPGQR